MIPTCGLATLWSQLNTACYSAPIDIVQHEANAGGNAWQRQRCLSRRPPLSKGLASTPKALCWAGAIALSIALCFPVLSWAGSERVDIARFSHGDLSGWQPKIFTGTTRYSLASKNGRTVLHADSSAAASGLYREVSIELGQTPILNWTWQIGHVLKGADERTRAGDDYAARIYVIFSGGVMFWRTRALNYVWSNNQPIGADWPNAYTGNARMIAVESGSGRAGQWISERRDVREDYRRVFGEEPGRVDAVAIMTDTDNTGATAKAWYGDIWFSPQ